MSDRFDPRLSFAETIPSSFYFEASVLDRERRAVFGSSWQLAGRAGQVEAPGQYVTTTVGDEPLLIVRGSDGELRALSNVCRHRAGPVARGEGKRPVLQCGYHGWTYSLEGRLLTTPEFEGIQCFDRQEMALPSFRVESWNGLLFVQLDPAAPSLPEFFGDLSEHLPARDVTGFTLAARKEWELECNWKVYVDNYLEGYHIPIVHPGLFREIDYQNYRTETREHYSIQHAPLRNPERIRVDGGDPEAQYFWIYPNLMLNVYPDNFSTNLIVPLSPTRTVTIFEWYFRDAQQPEVMKRVEDTVAFSDEIQLEDIAICEAVQRGLRSATYHRGRYSPSRENGVHHFHDLYAQAMGIERRS